MLETRLQQRRQEIPNSYHKLMLPGNCQGQEECAWCSYGVISEFGNKFCFLNLSVMPLDVPALCSLLRHNFTPQVIILNCYI